MKILITGGTGFIAKNLSEKLPKKHTLFFPNSITLNLLDSKKVFDYIKDNKLDVIIHTATYDAAPKYSTKDPSKVMENNLRMFFNIARCKDYFGKMIYFGSGAEFGRKNWIPKMREDYFDQYVPTDQYGLSKYIMTKYTMLNKHIFNLRLFAVFGKYDDWRTRFIPNACCRAILSKTININQNRFFDFIYIDDLIKIVEWFIDHTPKKNIYNVCTGHVYDFKNIAQKIIKLSGKKNLEIIIKTAGWGKEYSGNNTKLLKEIGCFKFTSITKSIKTLYKWYSSNKHIISEDKL